MFDIKLQLSALIDFALVLFYFRNDGESMVVLKSVDGFTDDSIFSIELTENLNKHKTTSSKHVLDIQINPQNTLELRVKVNSRYMYM